MNGRNFYKKSSTNRWIDVMEFCAMPVVVGYARTIWLFCTMRDLCARNDIQKSYMDLPHKHAKDKLPLRSGLIK
jgi:hypothetical protein